MNAETFFDAFDLLADAPNSVAKLRALILQLAVKGKLVLQDDNDEPASYLLQQISKQLGLPSTNIRSKKSTDLETPHRPPYAVPANWEWVHFHQVATIASNLVKPDKYASFPHVAPDNIEKFTGQLLPYKTVGEDEVRSANHHFLPGQLLYSKIRPNLAKATIVDFEGLCSADMYPINVHADTRYLLVYMLSEPFLRMAVRNDTRVAMPKINQEELNRILVPLPPLAEQRRIVSKVDELLGLCDELETRQGARRELRERLVQAALDQLLASRDPADFAAHWQRLQTHFDILFDTPEAVGRLRKAILHLAISRRLVSSDQSKPHGIDSGIVGDYVQLQNGYAFKSEWFVANGIRLLRNANIGIGELNWDDVQFVTEDRATEFERFALNPGDIVISLDRPLISSGLKVARIQDPDLPALLLQRVARCQFVESKVLPEYFYLWLQSPAFIGAIDPGRSNGVPHISTKDIQKLPFSLPPKSEQRQIVTSVQKLLSFCEQLIANLNESSQVCDKLLVAAVQDLLAAEQPTRDSAYIQDIERAADELEPTTKMTPHKRQRRSAAKTRPARSTSLIPLSKEVFLCRGSVASYAVRRLHQSGSFGETQLVKTLYVAQSHLGVKLGFLFARHHFGPLATDFYRLQGTAKKRDWFTTKPRAKGGVTYHPGTKLEEMCKYAPAYLKPKQAEFDRLLDHISEMNTDQAELFATAYAAWNDLLIDRRPADEETIIAEIHGWHEDKKRFKPPEIRSWLQWMRAQGYVPTGQGQRTTVVAKAKKDRKTLD